MANFLLDSALPGTSSWAALLERASGGLPSPEPAVVIRVEPPCAPGFKMPLVLDDRHQLDALAAAHQGSLPATFAYHRRCAICGKEHDFNVTPTGAQHNRLATWLERPIRERGPWSFSPERSAMPAVRSETVAARQIQNLRETPLARADRKYAEGMEATDDGVAITALEQAIELYASLPHRSGPVAQARLELAERLAEREPKRALELIELTLPILRDPAMRRPRERALELKKRLARAA